MKTHKNHLRLLILLLLVLLACAGYMTVGVHFENQKLFAYAMRIRTPKLIAMLITAFAIGSASMDLQESAGAAQPHTGAEEVPYG